jgi:hypothetical protein
MQAVEGEGEGEAGFGVGSDDAGDAVEFGFEGLEELGEGEDVELGTEPVHGVVMLALALEEPVIPDMGVAVVVVAEGDASAEFSGGHELGAEVYGFGGGHVVAPLVVFRG